MLALVIQREGYLVATAASGPQALELMDGELPDLLLTDVRMPVMDGLTLTRTISQRWPQLTVIVMSAFGSIDVAMQALKQGAYDYISKPFKPDEVALTLRKAQERERLRRENERLRERIQAGENDGDGPLGKMLVHSEAMQAVASSIRKVAPYQTTVLILGESGVGKELVCQALHQLSPRADAPFVAINCAAIPDALLESELFGHVRGAFTDAVSDRQGIFEQAKGGTLMLDEIGELPIALQVKLLRALQESEIRKVGDNRSIAVDVRVVAATSRPLEQMVEEGSFRSDLYYRLNVMPIEIPPLRERPEDIPPLVDRFLTRLRSKLSLSLHGVTPEAMRLLLGHRWPGNIRELENVLERAAVLSEDTWIKPADLRLPDAHPSAGSELALTLHFDHDDFSVKRAQRELERELILRALEATNGNRTHAAKLLELSHRALLYKIKSLNLG